MASESVTGGRLFTGVTVFFFLFNAKCVNVEVSNHFVVCGFAGLLKVESMHAHKLTYNYTEVHPHHPSYF